MRRFLPLLLLVCAVVSSGASAPVHGTPYEVAVIPKGTTHEYWKSLHAGAIKAQRELAAEGIPVNLIWKGPLREDDRDQEVQVVENFIGRQVSGIVLAPLDDRALVAPVEDAVAAGIPVVIVDSRLNSGRISSFVATDNRQGGRLAARRLGQLLGGKGRAIMLRLAVGSASTEDREAGFLEVMAREFPGVTLVSTDQYAGATRDTAKTAAENLLNRYGDRLDGVFASNESAAGGMLLALRDAGLAGGKVKFVGFDSGELLNAALESGDVQGLVVQDPLRMGYLGVKTLVAVLRGEPVAPVIDTGVTLVTPENRREPAMMALLHPPLDRYAP
jgi:ribose transport system substrate-binding protein